MGPEKASNFSKSASSAATVPVESVQYIGLMWNF